MAFSRVGKVKFAGHVALFFLNIVVLALATRVNRFQEFFFMADLFPFGLAIATLIILFAFITSDLALRNSYIGRVQFEIALFGILSVFWLAFNSFSTSRWRMIPFQCDTIPTDLPDERVWCKDVQALRGLVWAEFIACFFTTLLTLQYALTQYKRGYKHIFQMPLSRYHSQLVPPSSARDSEFLQFEKLS